jgi:hypothetical protein
VGGKVKAGKKDAGVDLLANTDLTTWVPPTSTPAEVRQYRRELHEKLDVLPFADAGPVLVVRRPQRASMPTAAAATATTSRSIPEP